MSAVHGKVRQRTIATLGRADRLQEEGVIDALTASLAPDRGSHFRIDEDKLEAEARLDGKWVLRTDTDLSAEEGASEYKELWMLETMFLDVKSLLDTRPIYHRHDETIRGHVM